MELVQFIQQSWIKLQLYQSPCIFLFLFEFFSLLDPDLAGKMNADPCGSGYIALAFTHIVRIERTSTVCVNSVIPLLKRKSLNKYFYTERSFCLFWSSFASFYLHSLAEIQRNLRQIIPVHNKQEIQTGNTKTVT